MAYSKIVQLNKISIIDWLLAHKQFVFIIKYSLLLNQLTLFFQNSVHENSMDLIIRVGFANLLNKILDHYIIDVEVIHEHLWVFQLVFQIQITFE
jgi:hypothetical protein